MQPTIGEQRINRLAMAIVRGGGVVTFPTAMAMLNESKQATSRTLDWFVRAGMLRKIRIPGGSQVWMSERALVREFDPDETPAVYRLSRNADRWVPGATFRHDQLALRVLFSLAAPCDLLTEHEIRVAGNWRNRIPDGVLCLSGARRLDGSEPPAHAAVAELEVETSRKTGAIYRPNGTQGGWAKLAERLYRVVHNWPEGRQRTSLGWTECTLVVASLPHAEAIDKKVQEVHRYFQGKDQEGDDGDCEATQWYYAELLPDGTVGAVEWPFLGRF